MNTEEILLTCLLAAAIALMLLRPFVVRQPALRPVRRKVKKRTVRGMETYRLARPARNKGYDPEASPVRVAISTRKIPSVHRFGRKRNNEAYSNR